MSRMNSDQLHRSTLGIYSSLMDDFNPSLQNLVSLGNSYVQAFKALAVTSEAYFSALSKIGEKAFNTMSSRSLGMVLAGSATILNPPPVNRHDVDLNNLGSMSGPSTHITGDVLIQISESQRRLTLELDGVFRCFSMEVLQEMDHNIRLDKDYLSGSRNQYEIEVHNLAAALERNLRRGTNQDCSDYVQFLRESNEDALKEEERRYRFLAEKHCGLLESIAHLMNKTGGSLQQRSDAWTGEVNATRQPEARRATNLDNTVGMKREEIRKSREEPPLGKIPSRAPSPQGSIGRSSAESVGGGSGGRSTRALVNHQAGSNPTLLPFTRGETITVMVQQPRNGWLYGRAESSSRQGWFPASYVEPVDDPSKPTSPCFSNSTLRSSSSSSSLFNQPLKSSQSGAAPPPPPPPPPSLTSNKNSEMQPMTTTHNRRVESKSENKRSQPQGSQPELFPRGTNPFATVKLKPTSTNDRSAPHVYRR